MISIFIPKRSLTLHIPGTGPIHDPDRSHLFVILTETDKDGLNLLVPICSIHKQCDRTCLIGNGDHKGIKRDSFVFYARCDFYKASDLTTRVKDRIISYGGMIDNKVFARIHAGIAASRFTPLKVKII